VNELLYVGVLLKISGSKTTEAWVTAMMNLIGAMHVRNFVLNAMTMSDVKNEDLVMHGKIGRCSPYCTLYANVVSLIAVVPLL
jgi:hypothetical protein